MREGYKVSELGNIPESWENVQLRDLLVLLTDFEANGSFADVKHNVRVFDKEDFAWYVRATDLENNKSLDSVKYVDEKSYRYLKKTTLEGNELLITKRGEIGKVYFFNKPEGIKATLAPNLYLLKLNQRVVPKYLFYYYISTIGNNSLKRINASTTLGALYKDDVKKLKLLLPPLPEQQKIASILSTVDEKIENIDAQIRQTRELKKSLMQQLLTKGIGHTKFKSSELGELPESWAVVNLQVLCGNNKNAIVDGPFGSNLKTEHYKESGIPIISSGFVTTGKFFASKYIYVDQEKFEKEKRSSVKGGDIVMAKIGARCGASAILPKQHQVSILSGNSLKISIDESNNSTYFCYQILISYSVDGTLDKIKTTGAQPAISLISLKKLKFVQPPLQEQQKIASILATVDEKLESLQTKKQTYQQLKKGLMQQLLTGIIRAHITEPVLT